VSPDPIIVCIDTFEDDDISGCYEVGVDAPPFPQELPATGAETAVVLLGAAVLLTALGAALVAWMRGAQDDG